MKIRSLVAVAVLVVSCAAVSAQAASSACTVEFSSAAPGVNECRFVFDGMQLHVDGVSTSRSGPAAIAVWIEGPSGIEGVTSCRLAGCGPVLLACKAAEPGTAACATSAGPNGTLTLPAGIELRCRAEALGGGHFSCSSS